MLIIIVTVLAGIFTLLPSISFGFYSFDQFTYPSWFNVLVQAAGLSLCNYIGSSVPPPEPQNISNSSSEEEGHSVVKIVLQPIKPRSLF